MPGCWMDGEIKYPAYPAWLAKASAERGVSFSRRRVRQGQARRWNPTVSTTPSLLTGTEGQKKLLLVTLLFITALY